ncbi:hypothetical protein L7F22_041462 [Adiantum nelumboides]|nr:hypothetical protein [Adiantum nelumboides]
MQTSRHSECQTHSTTGHAAVRFQTPQHLECVAMRTSQLAECATTVAAIKAHATEARTLASLPASASLSSVQYWANVQLPAVALPAELIRERVTGALDGGSNAAVASHLY